MMKPLTLTLTLAAVMVAAVLALVARPARGEPSQFVISNADAVSYITVTVSSTLNTLIAGVSPRFVIDHSNGMRYYNMTPISADLQTLIGQVGVRPVVQYANAMRYYSLTPISADLQTLIGQVGDRFVMQYANANRFYGLAYPVDLIGDTAPPQIAAAPTATGVGQGSVIVSWMTNEFATTVFEFGVSSGVYTQTITDTLFYKLHEVTLSGLTAGRTYYYRFRHSDRSGNPFQGAEYTFVVKVPVYLPLVRK